ncbi:hypothetical protein C8J57DRAFT_1473594 [Mycena rebaudengoi]|nr:hypothetical protein C8J57DRAFT_1473594 [Mycena rebaudengoi]
MIPRWVSWVGRYRSMALATTKSSADRNEFNSRALEDHSRFKIQDHPKTIQACTNLIRDPTEDVSAPTMSRTIQDPDWKRFKALASLSLKINRELRATDGKKGLDERQDMLQASRFETPRERLTFRRCTIDAQWDHSKRTPLLDRVSWHANGLPTGSYYRQLVASQTCPHSGPIGDYSWLQLRIGWFPAVFRMCWISSVHVVATCLTVGGVGTQFQAHDRRLMPGACIEFFSRAETCETQRLKNPSTSTLGYSSTCRVPFWDRPLHRRKNFVSSVTYTAKDIINLGDGSKRTSVSWRK